MLEQTKILRSSFSDGAIFIYMNICSHMGTSQRRGQEADQDLQVSLLLIPHIFVFGYISSCRYTSAFITTSVSQSVSVSCSVLQCDAESCGVLQCWHTSALISTSVLQCVVVCCGVL